MLRRIGLVCLTTTLLLSIIVGNPLADFWYSWGWSDNWKVQCTTPLPPGHERYHWTGGCDFWQVRAIDMTKMKFWRLLGDLSLAMLASYTIGCYTGAAKAGVAGAALSAEVKKEIAKESLKTAFVSGPIVGSGLSFGGYSPTELAANWVLSSPTIEELEKKIEFLRSKAGVSDYFAFGTAEYTPKGGETHRVTVPLGARMKFQIKPGVPSPPVFCLRDPEKPLNFRELGSRVWEYKLGGEVQPTSVQCVFAYEEHDGQVVPSREGETLKMLDVQPESPEAGGRVVGKKALGYLPGLGWAGLRKIYLASPINERWMVQSVQQPPLKDFSYTIMINKQTTSVVGPPSAPEPSVGKELVITLSVERFHTAEAIRKYGSDWLLVANEIVRGVQCEGAGIKGVDIQHDRKRARTLLKCMPRKAGKVNVILQTIHGPVIWEDVVTVKEDPFSGSWEGTIRGRRIKGRHPHEFFEKGGREITHRPPVGVWEKRRSFKFRVVTEGEQAIRVFFGSDRKGNVFDLHDNIARRRRRDENFTPDPTPGVISIVYRDWDWTLTFKKNEVRGKVYCTTMFSDRLWEKEEFEIEARRVEQMD